VSEEDELMSMGKREEERQSELWLATSNLAESPGHPFYERLNAVLREAEFDARTEALCESYYAKGRGRPSVPPGVYFRMLLVGYFEGIASERGIAWRCADSLALRAFLGIELDESTPDSSSLCRIRQRLDVEVHQAVFQMVLEILDKRGLLRGKTIGIDATTLEANAALRSIVRRDDGAGYEDFLGKLAKESGIETPTRSDLAKIDRKRPRKGSNDDWEHPHDPDAQITKMKDGRTHLAHKSEHAVDMDSGAVLAVTLHGGVAGDTKTLSLTMEAACEQSLAMGKEQPQEWVADKGYHSNETMELMEELGLRGYISEPDRGQRRWKGKATARNGTYANRRRIRGNRGRKLLRQRGERVERSFAHCLETGAMRRTWLRGHQNILKRYLLHVAGFNLGLVMRQAFGAGTPRGAAALGGFVQRLCALARARVSRVGVLIDALPSLISDALARAPRTSALPTIAAEGPYSAGC
jgi:transposase